MSMLPLSEMQSIMATIAQDDEDNSLREYLNYGANAGDERFRLALQLFLERRTKDDDMGIYPNESASDKQNGPECELFITSGVSHGLELLCRTCTQPGDEVWVERPTYFLAPTIFESNGLVVKSLPMMSDRKDEPGDIGQIDINRLIHMVETERLPAPKMIYVIPSYHNPTGRSMSMAERRQLASFSLKHGVILVADEVYHLLDWEQKEGTKLNNNIDAPSQRPAGIVHFNGICNEANTSKPPTCTQHGTNAKVDDGMGCCISVSSFTKIWAPGIRLGWINAPSFIIRRLENYGYIDSQGGVAPLMGRVMAEAIKSNLLDIYLDKLKVEYAERYELVCKLLTEEPRIATLSRNSPVARQGGYFIWVGFPPDVNSDDFLSYSLKTFGVRFMSGTKTDPFPSSEGDISGESIRSCARICFADLEREELVKGTLAFIEAFRAFMNSK